MMVIYLPAKFEFDWTKRPETKMVTDGSAGTMFANFGIIARWLTADQ